MTGFVCIIRIVPDSRVVCPAVLYRVKAGRTGGISGRNDKPMSEAIEQVRRIVVSPAGMEKLKEQLKYLEDVRRPQAAEQISIARRKAGISPREKISLQRFEVVRHR